MPSRNGPPAASPPDELERPRPHLHGVTLVLNRVPHETATPSDDVYRVQDGPVSYTADTGGDGVVEVGVTGREGTVGPQGLLGPEAQGPVRQGRGRVAVLDRVACGQKRATTTAS